MEESNIVFCDNKIFKILVKLCIQFSSQIIYTFKILKDKRY